MSQPAAPPHQQQPKSFTARKNRILARLSAAEDKHTDASPKGCVDAGIRQVLDEINAVEGLATTSSCAGRVSVFVEGVKDGDGNDNDNGGEEAGQEEGAGSGGGRRNKMAETKRKTTAGIGGKGGGGTWLFVSHDVLRGDAGGWATTFGFDRVEGRDVWPWPCSGRERLIRFKFEPMVSLKKQDRGRTYMSCTCFTFSAKVIN